MSAPLIGITQRRLSTAQIEGVPASILDTWMNAQFVNYARAVQRAGGVPVYISREADAEVLAERLDGMLLTGGLDVDPRWYGKVPTRASTFIDPDGDRYEVGLVEACFTADVPMLAICRGLQVINVALGGTLVEDLPVGDGHSHAFLLYPPHERVHRVEFTPGSLLQRMFGPDLFVNSLHHLSVEKPGRGVVVTARADDGEVEGIEVPGRRVLAVQWHPEFFKEPDPVFEWLVRESLSTAEEGGVLREENVQCA